jgi:tyrosyl-DNA phosphodiesterase 2
VVLCGRVCLGRDFLFHIYHRSLEPATFNLSIFVTGTSHDSNTRHISSLNMFSKSVLPSLLKKQLAYIPQPFYTFHANEWRPSHSSVRSPPPLSQTPPPFHSLNLITWNIDFMAPYPQSRMSAALAHLHDLVDKIPTTSAIIIFLQEMQQKSEFPTTEHTANDITQLQNAAFVRKKFHMTDLGSLNWEAHYGTVTLVDRRLDVRQVARQHFMSEYGRDALFVDVGVAGEKKEKVCRLCNVHLDSLAGPARPAQWRDLAGLLQQDSLAASIVAGDCNANQPRDRTEPQDHGFKDAYLECGGIEGGEEGATWGFQSTHWKRYGRKRLDKVAFWGDLEVKSLERIGVQVEVAEERVVKELEELGKLPYATDHYGLMGVFNVPDGLCSVP